MRGMRLFCALLFFICTGVSYAQHFFSFGLNAGVYGSIMQDFDKRAIAKYIYQSTSALPSANIYKYHNFSYGQYGYFLNENDEIAISPVAALSIGYEIKRFAFFSGLEFIFNINENFSCIYPEDGKTYAVVGYTYSLVNLPFFTNFYFINKPKFKFGLSLGIQVSIPLGDVTKSLPVKDGVTPVNIFRKAGDRVNLSYEEELKNDTTFGVRAGFAGEAALKNGAITFDITYLRSLTGGATSMLLDSAINADAVVEDTERKVTIMTGVRITIGYKFKIPLKGTSANSIELESGNYYMIVDGKTEGPLSLSEMQNLASKKLLTKDTVIWKKGISDWQKASLFTELNDIFEN